MSRFTLPVGDPRLTSAAPAPRRAGAKVASGSFQPALDGPVPAYAFDLGSSSLVSLDAADPAIVQPLANLGDLTLTAGAFVDEDFSQLYAIDFRSFHLLTVDTATGASTVIGTADSPGLGWTSLSWDASTTTLYGVTYSQSRSGFTTTLYTVDPVTAATTLVGPITGIGDPSSGTLLGALAVDSKGLMYGIDLVADDFVAIDKTTGAAAVIGSLGFDANYAQAMDFDDYTGTLYYAAFNNSTGEAEMYTIDQASGALTLISPIGADPLSTQLDAFAIARLGGVCAYPDDVPWLSYDVTRGSTPAGGSSPVNVTFDASALPAGTYTGNVCVANNDLTNRRVAVPVTLTVQ